MCSWSARRTMFRGNPRSSGGANVSMGSTFLICHHGKRRTRSGPSIAASSKSIGTNADRRIRIGPEPKSKPVAGCRRCSMSRWSRRLRTWCRRPRRRRRAFSGCGLGPEGGACRLSSQGGIKQSRLNWGWFPPQGQPRLVDEQKRNSGNQADQEAETLAIQSSSISCARDSQRPGDGLNIPQGDVSLTPVRSRRWSNHL